LLTIAAHLIENRNAMGIGPGKGAKTMPIFFSTDMASSHP